MSAQLAQALRDLLSYAAENDPGQGGPERDDPRITAASEALAAFEAAPQQEPVASIDELAGNVRVCFGEGAAAFNEGVDALAAEYKRCAAPQQAQAPIDPDGAESRAGFRAFDESQMARWATPWQVWREAVKWAARPAQQAQAPKVAVCDFVQVDGFGKHSRSQHDADSAELRSLCKARDDARRERDMLRAELAGHEASGGHLSALVDDLRGLLSEAMRVMKALHESASPDDGPEMNAIVPAGAFHEFVDANAALMHKIHISPHGDGVAAPQQGSNT